MKVWLRGHRICWRKVKGGDSGQFNALDVEFPQRKTQHNHHGHHWQHHHSHHYHHHHHHDWPAKLWLNPLQPALPWRQIASIIPHPPEIHFNMDTFINPLDIHSSPEIHPPSWDTFTLLKHIYPCDMPIWRGKKSSPSKNTFTQVPNWLTLTLLRYIRPHIKQITWMPSPHIAWLSACLAGDRTKMSCHFLALPADHTYGEKWQRVTAVETASIFGGLLDNLTLKILWD